MGEFLLVQGYNGDSLQVQVENKDVAFALSREGTMVSCDDFVVLKNAQPVELAHKLINFFHDPKVSTGNVEYTFSLCPNKACRPLLSAEIRARCEIMGDGGAAHAIWVTMGDEIRAAKTR